MTPVADPMVRWVGAISSYYSVDNSETILRTTIRNFLVLSPFILDIIMGTFVKGIR